MKKFAVAILFFLISGSTFAAFSDTANYQWKDSIDYLLEDGVVIGYENGEFRPDKKINRAEFMKIVLEGVYIDAISLDYAAPCFTDITGDEWFAHYLCFGKETGIIDGHPDGSFRPSDNVTQPEALKIIFNTIEEDVVDFGGEWYQQYLDHAEWIGMLYFDSLNGAPYQISRGEMAYFTTWLIEPDEIDQIDSDDFYTEEYFDIYAMTPDQCLEGEVYDEDLQVCYFECFTNEECAEAYGIDFDFDEDVAQDQSNEGAFNIISSYEVKGNTIELIENSEVSGVELEWQEKSYLHQETWDLFAQMVPAGYRADLTKYQIFTDGKNGTMAAVMQDPNDINKWILQIDLEDAYLADGSMNREELVYTLIHELGHLISLNKHQVDYVFWRTDAQYEAEALKCSPNFFIPEGCLKNLSYLNQFFQNYWAGDLYDLWEEIEFSENEDDYYAALLKFYFDNQSSFVTNYSATNPREDIAETWTYFVTRPKPTGNSIADQKVLSLYKYPELLSLKENILRSL